MLTAAFWGLVQGLTEFLPISSSGHLILVPALLGMDAPDLATSAVLHLGTLIAIVWYYRSDVRTVVTAPTSPHGKRILMLLLIGTIPAAVIGLSLQSPIEIIFTEPWIVAISLVVTGFILLGAHWLPAGERRMEDARAGDAVLVGFAQAIALLPGISRSAMTITGGLAQGLTRHEAARYAFLLGVPAIGGAGMLEAIDVFRAGAFEWSLLVGTAVAAVVGYLTIGWLIKLLERFGVLPFALYCIGFGALAYFLV